MICENAPCPMNQKGRCFTAMFLGKQGVTVTMFSYWQAMADKVNVQRHGANMAPVTPEFLRAEYIQDTRTATANSMGRYCRTEDTSLSDALTIFDAMVMEAQPA